MKEPENNTYMNEGEYNQDISGADFLTEEVYGNADGGYFTEADIQDIDFSEFRGKSFKGKLSKVKKAVSRKKRKAPEKPLTEEFSVTRRATLYGKQTAKGEAKTTKRIIVPSTQKVIVEGVDNFILNEDKSCVKQIGYYNCKKLDELIITISNISGSPFTINLFDPSMPLDYLQSTSLNLNNKVQIAGGNVQYSDVLFNILANPMHIPNAKFTFAGPTFQQQINEPLRFVNKKATGEQKITPMQLQLKVDNMQVAQDIVFFNLDQLNRPFIPNGMDIMQYTIYAGNTVTFAFFYRQPDIRKFFFPEAKNSKILL